MADYNNLRVPELRRLCEDRDIEARGLTKPRLIDALRASDAAHYDDNDDDSEVELGRRNGDEYSDADDATDYESLVGDGGEPEPESVTVLRLKLALADRQAKRERDRDERARQADERARQAREHQ